MASSVIGALRVNLGLDSAQFTRGANRAQRRVAQMGRQFAAVTGVVAAFGAALTGVALRGAADMDRLVKGARRIDGSTGALQALELAASEAGVSISALTNDVQTMNRELSSGSAGSERALQRLSMSAADLAAMDADERVAAIADRVKELGLSAGEATDLLRDLGVRNREMALLMIQGGDAIRRARDDVRDYGLEIDEALGAKIEAARDQIGRLTVVTQYFGQRLAAEIVPALGAFAQAITDSMREGGALRFAIDGLVENMQLLASIAAAAVITFGVRYVAAMVAATYHTWGLVAALAALKTALVRTGIGALIVGLGLLGDFMIRVSTTTATWGEVLKAVYEVGKSVFLGIGRTAWGLSEILAGVASAITGSFVRAFAEIAKSWDRLVNGMAAAWNAIADTAFGDTLGLGRLGESNVSGTLGSFADALFDQAENSIKRGGKRIKEAGAEVGAAYAELSAVINRGADFTDEAAEKARELAAALDEMGGEGGSGGGGAAGRAAKGLEQTTNALDEFSEESKRASDNFASLVRGILQGTTSIGDALNRIGGNMLESGLSGLFQASGIGDLFAGFFDSGGTIPRGQFGIVGERRPELVTGPTLIPGPARVTGGAETARILNGGMRGGFSSPGAAQAPVRVEVVARVENGSIVQDVREIAGDVSVRVVREGLRQFDRTVLPESVNRIMGDRRRRG